MIYAISEPPYQLNGGIISVIGLFWDILIYSITLTVDFSIDTTRGAGSSSSLVVEDLIAYLDGLSWLLRSTSRCLGFHVFVEVGRLTYVGKSVHSNRCCQNMSADGPQAQHL